MQSKLVYLRPARLVYLRVSGPYATAIPEAWDKMSACLARHGGETALIRCYGLARDNPELVAASECRYDACAEVEPYFMDRVVRDLGTMTLPGGSYVRRKLKADMAGIISEVAGLHASFEPPSGLRLDSNRPIVTLYINDPRKTDAADIKVDVCVPVAVGNARAKAASAA